MQPALSTPLLAVWECLIGLGFLTGCAPRLTRLLFCLQLPGTMLPLFLFPRETFIHFPYDPCLEGQYIIKNAVLASGAFLMFVTMRGGRIVAGTHQVRR